MNIRDWNYLSDSLTEQGLISGEMPEEGVQLHEHLASKNGITAAEALEWFAGIMHMLPLDPSRPACSSRGENIFRRLAMPCTDEEPWLPIGSLGPLLICTHYNPTSGAMWNIPPELIIPVIIPQAAYDILKKDIDERLSFKPLERQEPIVITSPLPRREGLDSALKWLLEEYPLEDTDARARILEESKNLLQQNGGDPACLRKMIRGLGLALHFLATGEACFNAEHAPTQSVFPEGLLDKHKVYPLYCGKKIVYLLSEEKHNYAFEDEWVSGGNESFAFRTVRADKETIQKVIDRDRGRTASSSDATPAGEMVDSDVQNIVDIDVQSIQKVNPSSINVTPEQVVHWVLNRAIAGRASDLHIEKFYNMARFRARIDGELKVIHSCPEEQLPRFVSLIKNYSNMGQRRQDAQDGRFSLLLGKRRVDCRVSAIPCRKDQQKITIRFLDKKDGVRKLEALNLPDWHMGVVKDAMSRDQGLILITGPTGSGKTTTLYALLNSINSENINIHTIEDPIEYEVEGLNQTQTDPHNGINFAEGLRRLMRADPDVILIGECRDEETANAAVNAALTGHLVLTTLHANDCLRAVSRFISMGIPPYLLADSLALTQAQRLVRRLCTYCKKPTEITDDMRKILRTNRIPIPPDVEFVYTKQGCPECNETGYSGRMALMEMCPIDNEIADLIATNAPQSKMRELAFQKGVMTLYQQGLQQVLAGNTTFEEVSCLAYTALTEEPESDDPTILHLSKEKLAREPDYPKAAEAAQ
jgi:type II secretory ATPase GspE/PulE/Tfp pilus assembly ATPase PilB-like protein